MPHLMNTKTAVPGALLAILLGSSSAGAVGVADAAPPGYELATRVVKYGDLDLTRRAGVSALYSRIQSATRAVCEPAISTGAKEATAGVRRCREQALTRAVADVNAPALTNYYLTKTKQAITLAREP